MMCMGRFQVPEGDVDPGWVSLRVGVGDVFSIPGVGVRELCPYL